MGVKMAAKRGQNAERGKLKAKQGDAQKA
jgi:hypothetical protein